MRMVHRTHMYPLKTCTSVNIFNVSQFNDNINEYQYIFWELVSSGQSPIGVRLVQAYETFTQPLGNYHYS